MGWRRKQAGGRVGRYDHVPGLEGLPDEQQVFLYRRARRQSLRGSYAGLAIAVAGAFVALSINLGDALFRSRWNPGLPEALVFGLVLAAGSFVLWLLRRWFDRHFVAPHIWRHLPHLCDACGYDLTGNASNTCPECGHGVRGARNK